MRRFVHAAALVLTIGCGSSGGRDLGLDAVDQGPAPLPAELPRIDWLEDGDPPLEMPWREAGVPPIAWDCPSGWRERTDDAVTTCEPYPEGGPETCGEGEVHYPGGDGCEPVGRACGDAPFPPVDDADAAVYVQTGASGDGSLASPFGTLSAALAAAAAGSVIVLAEGTYEVDRALPAGVSLRGRCAALTRLAPAEGLSGPLLTRAPGADRIEVRDVSLRPAGRGGLRLGGSMSLLGVEVRGAGGFGVSVGLASDLDAEGLVVVDGVIGPSDADGAALAVFNAGRATVRRAVFDRNEGRGVLGLLPGTDVELEDIAIRNTTSGRLPQGGEAITVQSGAGVVLRRALLEGSQSFGLLHAQGGASTLDDVVIRDVDSRSSDGRVGVGVGVQVGAIEMNRVVIELAREQGVNLTDATATLNDVVIRDTLGRPDGAGGRGLEVVEGSRLTAQRLLLTRHRELGLLAFGEDTRVDLTDFAILDTAEQASDGRVGRGMSVELGAAATLTRGRLDGNTDIGLFVRDAGTALTATDLVVSNTRAEASDGTGGRGLDVTRGPTATLTRAILEANREVGLLASGLDTLVTLTDVAVRDTAPNVGSSGYGITAQLAAEVRLTRVVVERSFEAGIFAAGEDTALRGTDLVVRDTDTRFGFNGEALYVIQRARAELERVLFARNRTSGISASGSGSTIDLVDVTVRETAAGFCEPDCAGPAGTGVAAIDESTVTLERFVLSGGETCGVQLATDGELDLREGVVTRHPIAVCLQIENYPRARLQQNVAYIDNEVLLESTRLPLPGVLGALAELD